MPQAAGPQDQVDPQNQRLIENLNRWRPPRQPAGGVNIGAAKQQRSNAIGARANPFVLPQPKFMRAR